jgi:hypothetical protein
MKIQRAIMPNDTAIVDPTTGRLNQAWVNYLGNIDRISRALAAVELPPAFESGTPTNDELKAAVNAIIAAFNGE